MPRRKSITTKTVRADHWEPHEAVVIRSFNSEDEELIDDEITSVDVRGHAKILAGHKRHLTLCRAIVSWTLTDEHSRPLPLNETSIRSLAPEDTMFLFDEITKLNAPMSVEEKKASTMPATTGIEEKQS